MAESGNAYSAKSQQTRRGSMGDNPGVQFRTTVFAADVISSIAKRERRTMKDQSEILIIAGARALGYDVSSGGVK